MPRLFIEGKPLVVDPRKTLGKGMEADVYLVGGLAVKIFKDPGHPDLLTDFDREAARKKIEEHQDKLPAFPRGLPSRVVVPIDLVRDQRDRIVGYTMRLVNGAKNVRSYGQVSERLVGVDPNQIVRFFSDLHVTVRGLHAARVVVGDFNDLNVLASGEMAHVIDADSFQFGRFPCRMFTEEFVDPRLCDQDGNAPLLVASHDPDSDWYAFAAMLFKTLLCVAPFGGVYKPARKRDLVLHTQRPLKGVSVFNAEVVYPRKAIPYRLLPDDVLAYFRQVFEERKRGEFPEALLSSVRWSKCKTCGAEHARSHCPDCQAPLPAAAKETVTVSGKIKSTSVFRTPGTILHSSFQGGKLLWLYSEDGKFVREDRSPVVDGVPEQGMRFRLAGADTVIGKGGMAVVIRKGEATRRLAASQYQDKFSMFDASAAGLFWVQDGAIVRANRLGLDYEPDRIGQVLDGQTLFWVGDNMGAGFYRAGEFGVFFVFNPRAKGINDSVDLPRIRGQLVGARCLFSSSKAAMLFAFKDGPAITNRCVMVGDRGEVMGVAEAREGDGSWLSEIKGKCVVGGSVLSATDSGVVKVDFAGGSVSKETVFEGSERFVDAGSHIFPAADGIYCVGDREIRLLQICR